MTVGTGNPELSSLRAKCASLEARLKEERSAHGYIAAVLQERVGRWADDGNLRLVLENMPVMMNAFDEDGVCVAWNRECERVTGYSAAEMIGTPHVPDLVMPDPAYRARMIALWPSKKDAKDWEVEFTAKDGRKLTIAWSSISDQRPVSGWASWAIGMDVTERNEAETALKKSRDEFEQQVEDRTSECEDVNARLRVEREHLQGVLDTIADGVVTINETGTIESINPAAEQMFGYTAREVIGKNVAILMSDSDRSQHNGYISAYHDTREGKILGVGPREVTAQRKDGTSFSMELSIGKMDLGDRQVFICSMRDITERKQADAAIRETQEMLSAFMDAANERFIILDGDLNVLEANNSVTTRLHLSKDEIIGRNIAEIAPAAISSGRYENYREVLRTGKPYSLRGAYADRWTGREVSIEGTAFRIGQSLLGITIYDVTKRVEAEQALRVSEVRFRDFAESASDGLWETDANLRYTNVWGVIMEGLREKGRDPIGKTRWEHIGVDPSRDEHWRKHKENLEAHRPFRDFEYSYVNSRGRQHRRASGRPIFDAGGSFIGYRGVVENRTAAVEAEWEARRVQDRLEHAVNHMPLSIALYDAEDRLVVRNNVIRDFGSIADQVRPGTRFEDLVRAGVAAGLTPEALGREEEYIRERLERHRNPTEPFEQLRRGRRLEIREHKLPDGATIVIQVDVTEKRAAEQRIKESERRLLESQRIARIGTILHDILTGEVVWTDEAFRLLGFEPGEVHPSFEEYLERLNPDDVDDALQARAALDRGEQPVDALRRVVWPDGSIHVLDNVVKLERDLSGKPIRVTRTIQDVTNRVQAEDRLRASRDDLAAAQRIAQVGSWRWDIDTDELIWSDEHWAIFGLEPGEVRWIDPAFFDTFVHPDDLEAVQSAKRLAIETGASFSAEFRIVRRDGEVRYVHSRSESDGIDHGRHFVGTIQDVTDRVQAEAALRSSQSMFERAFESSPSLASIVSVADHRLLKVNDAWCQKLGYKSEEVIGKTTDELDLWLEEDAKRRAREEVAQTGAVRAFPTVLRSALGDAISVEAFADTLEFEGGKAIFTVAHDRTERKIYEDALWEAKENAELANRTKSEFLANVSHELRTPLNAILGFSEMMSSGLAGPLTEKQSEYLSDVRASGEHLLSLIGDVIDLSTIELGRLKLILEQIDLHECVEECVTQLKNKIVESGLRLRVCDLAALPPVRGDKRRIKQVIINLLSNAMKFTDPEGEINLEGIVTGKHECAITIADTGVGMTQAMTRQALTAFKRGDDPLLRNVEGAGLGLSLVQSMVEAHGGSVAIQSAVGEGTKVTVTFPIDGPPEPGAG